MIKILLDENLPDPIKKIFSRKIDVRTVHDLNWQSKENGELLRAVDDEGIEAQSQKLKDTSSKSEAES